MKDEIGTEMWRCKECGRLRYAFQSTCPHTRAPKRRDHASDLTKNLMLCIFIPHVVLVGIIVYHIIKDMK